ncbi:MAG: squalene/phytoene synthase family protein [Gemmatimonadota bacterium]|jgi:farnesyl-diphosphate farnesyltransferase
MRFATTTHDELYTLLEETSRTFALAIPLLPEPLCTEVTEAYLLFRIADTFEDATRWPVPDRIAALDELARILEESDGSRRVGALARRWRDREPIAHAGYLRLLEEAPLVFQALWDTDNRAAAIIVSHTVRTCRGMACFLRRAGEDGILRLHTLDELRAYCYTVAGIVGEMLTELILLECDDEGLAPRLRTRARRFGEALQLVNVLRDSRTDVREGRALVPDSVSRDALFRLARADLREAAEYTLALQDASAARGIVAFNALPVLLAMATLDRVEEAGPGSKIVRARVWAIMAKLKADIRLGRPVIRLKREAPAPPAPSPA